MFFIFMIITFIYLKKYIFKVNVIINAVRELLYKQEENIPRQKLPLKSDKYNVDISIKKNTHTHTQNPIHSLKNRKAAGREGIRNELLKYGSIKHILSS